MVIGVSVSEAVGEASAYIVESSVMARSTTKLPPAAPPPVSPAPKRSRFYPIPCFALSISTYYTFLPPTGTLPFSTLSFLVPYETIIKYLVIKSACVK